MDEADLAISRTRPAADEGNAVKTQVKGQLRCVVVVPKQPAAGNPWSWQGLLLGPRAADRGRAAQAGLPRRLRLVRRRQAVGRLVRVPDREARALEEAGVHRHEPRRAERLHLGHRQPRQGVVHLRRQPRDQPRGRRACSADWRRPTCRCCTSAAASTRSWATTRCVVEGVYQQLGGRISVMIKDGAGPPPAQPARPQADRRLHRGSSQKPAAADPPAFVGKAFTRIVVLRHRERLPRVPEREDVRRLPRAVVRRRATTGTSSGLDGIRMPVSVIVPKAAAPGKPWVFRGDFVTRDAAVDLALLGKGFHIVTGPVPTDTDGPVLAAVERRLQAPDRRRAVEDAGSNTQRNQ